LASVDYSNNDIGPVYSAYNPSFSVCFFSRNNIFLSQQISQQCFSAGLSAQPNGSIAVYFLEASILSMCGGERMSTTNVTSIVQKQI
jgi:hypothetical protein